MTITKAENFLQKVYRLGFVNMFYIQGVPELIAKWVPGENSGDIRSGRDKKIHASELSAKRHILEMFKIVPL